MSVARFLSDRGIRLTDAVVDDREVADVVTAVRLPGVDPAKATVGDFVRAADAFDREVSALMGSDAEWTSMWRLCAKAMGFPDSIHGADFVAYLRGVTERAGVQSFKEAVDKGRRLKTKIALVEAEAKRIETKLNLSAVSAAIRDVPMTPHQRMSVLNQCRDHGPEAALSMAEAVGASVREAMPVWYRQSLETPKPEPQVTFDHPAKMAAEQGGTAPAMTNAEKHAFIAQHGAKAYRDLKRSN